MTKAKPKKAPSVDDFLGGYQSPRMTVRVSTRADLLARHSELHAAHQRALRGDMQENRSPEAPAIVVEIKKLEEEIFESEFEFTFQALGRGDYLRLQAANPPSPQDKKDGLPFNSESFPVALIAACAVDPTMTAAQAQQLVERLSDGQFTKVWNAAVAVNVGDDASPKSVMRSGTAAPAERSSTTAPPEGSGSPSS